MKCRLLIFGLLLSIFFGFNCETPKERFEIIPFSIVDKTDTSFIQGSSKRKLKMNNYLIRGFKSYELNSAQIDSFVCSKLREIDSILLEYPNYIIDFYNESEITNAVHMQDHERDLIRYSRDNDFIYSYIWSTGDFLGRYDKTYEHSIQVLNCNE